MFMLIRLHHLAHPMSPRSSLRQPSLHPMQLAIPTSPYATSNSFFPRGQARLVRSPRQLSSSFQPCPPTRAAVTVIAVVNSPTTCLSSPLHRGITTMLPFRPLCCDVPSYVTPLSFDWVRFLDIPRRLRTGIKGPEGWCRECFPSSPSVGDV